MPLDKTIAPFKLPKVQVQLTASLFTVTLAQLAVKAAEPWPESVVDYKGVFFMSGTQRRLRARVLSCSTRVQLTLA